MSAPTPSRAPTRPLFLLALSLAACDPRMSSDIVVEDPVGPGNPGNPAARAVHLQVLEPTGDLAAQPGGSATVVVAASDSLGMAKIRVVADGDGDLATTADQYELGTTPSTTDRTPRSVAVTFPGDIPLGTYSILGALEDDGMTTLVARAPGRLVVDISHSLTIQEPADDVTVSRGGHVRVDFVVTDRDGSADVRFVADADGDIATTADQFVLASTVTAAQAPESLSLDFSAVPFGTWRLIGIASDAGNPDVVAIAPGAVTVANVAFATADGGTDYEEGRSIAALPDSSLVVTGRFAGSSLFGEWPTFTSLNSSGDDDLFLARYSPTGAMQWAVPVGGPSRGDWGNAIATFSDGSILLGGYFHGLASFNGLPLAGGVTSYGEDDAFVARYTANGALQWVRKAGGVFHDEVSGVAVLPDGDFVVTGQFTAQGTFGEGASTVALLVNGAVISSDGFVARYHGDGSLVWVKQFGGASGNDQGVAIAAAADGSCIVTGTFVDAATFGEGANQASLISAGGTDVFFARYDANGTLLWVRRGGGSGEDAARGIASLPTGEVVACGSYYGTSTFGGSGTAATLQSVGARDAYLVRFAANGSLTWARSAGGTNDDEARGIVLADDGSLTVTGSFHTFATFGAAPVTRTLSAVGLRDVFVAHYDANGTIVWAKRAGGTNHDLGNAIALLPDGSCAVTGSFQGDATFGTGGAARILSANGLGDVFVARFNADGDF